MRSLNNCSLLSLKFVLFTCQTYVFTRKRINWWNLFTQSRLFSTKRFTKSCLVSFSSFSQLENSRPSCKEIQTDFNMRFWSIILVMLLCSVFQSKSMEGAEMRSGYVVNNPSKSWKSGWGGFDRNRRQRGRRAIAEGLKWGVDENWRCFQTSFLDEGLHEF